MKRLFTILQLLLLVHIVSAQVGIYTETPDQSSALDIAATNKGFLPPRVNLTSIYDVTTIENPATGLMIYEPDGFTETLNGQTLTRLQGVYTYDGTQWIRLVASNSSDTGSSAGNSIVGVKLNINQSGYLTLQGSQSYGLLMQNAGVTINPTYVTGNWPPQSSQPSDVITDGAGGDSGARILENPVDGRPNFFRMNFNYTMGNNPPTDTKYFTISVVSVATGATVYSDEIIVPGHLNTGHVAPFEIAFPTLTDEYSIGNGYKIIFGVDTAGSEGLPGNISVMFLDMVRIN